MSTAKIAWAREIGSGITRHITEVDAGLACKCLCEGCNTPLEAVNSRNRLAKRRPHFRHYETPESGSCAERALLAAARRGLEGLRTIKTPSFSVNAEVRDSRGLLHRGVAAAAESELTYQSIAFIDNALAVLTLDDGMQVYVILCVATENFRSDIPSGTPVMIFDLEGQQFEHPDPDALRARIQIVARNKCWLHHPRSHELYLQAERAALYAARRADEEYAAAEVRAIDVPLPPLPPKPAAFEFAPSEPWLQEATPAPPRKAVLDADREERVQVSAYPLEWTKPPIASSRAHAIRRFAIAWSNLPWGDIHDAAISARDAGYSPEAAVLLLVEDYGARIGVARDFLQLALLIRKKFR